MTSSMLPDAVAPALPRPDLERLLRFVDEELP